MMTEVLWKTLTRTTGPYFLALESKVTQRRLSTPRDVGATSQVQQEEQGTPPQEGAVYGLGVQALAWG